MFEQVVNILSIVLNLAGLMICLFIYFEHTHKPLSYAMIFFLGSFLSNYYWGVYMLVMFDYPNVSSFLAYLGWNVAFVMLVFTLIALRKERGIESLKPVSPIALIPVPLNIAQLILYLQYGGIFNNLWQVFWATCVAVLSLDSIIRYVKDKKQGAKYPYVDAVVFVYIVLEFIEWTSSCFDWPSEALNPYNYASLIACGCFVLFPLAFRKEYEDDEADIDRAPENRLMKVFKPIYITVVVVCCIGGYFLALWMRNTLNAGIGQMGESDPFSIIAVMLFVVSLIIVSFTVTIILVVSSEQKNREREALEAARFLAEKSNTAKSEFLANMSHEIRTPINAVLGMNEMIFREGLRARDELPSDRDEIKGIFADICNYAGNIDSAGKNLLSIINDILDFSKIEAGKLEMVDNDYQLSSVLNDVSNMITLKARSKGLSYDVEVDDKLPDTLRGDEVRVRQIVTNLLNNAVKYTENGSVILSVSEKKDDALDDDELDLVISVKDTGIGIKDEDKDKLFDKFERVDIEKNSTIEGTGLGLAITGSLVEMMGGTIDVESSYGHGSTFTAVIPQKVISEEPIGDFREKFEKSISSRKAKKDPFHAPNAHILVVDDTPMNLTVVKGLLKNTLINIDTALSGEESIRMCEENKYDIVMMDQRMPGMDGITALHRIKDDERSVNAQTVFICLTADAITGAKERYLAEGFNDYLTKPIDSEELEEILVTYLPKEKLKSVDTVIEAENSNAPETIQDEHTEATGQDEPHTPVTIPDEPHPAVSIPENPLIDTEAGIELCTGDEEFYKEVLAEYLAESEKKYAALEWSYKERSWNDYCVHVHSLKSTSKTIGAIGLSEIAAELEAAANNEDTDTIEKDHDKMMEMYQAVTDILRNASVSTEGSLQSEDIIEFTPKQ